MTTKTLYALMAPLGWTSGDLSCALIEDTGEVLHEHICSTKGWARIDLKAGLERRHPGRFPDGYEWVEADSWSDVPEAVREANKVWAASGKEEAVSGD